MGQHKPAAHTLTYLFIDSLLDDTSASGGCDDSSRSLGGGHEAGSGLSDLVDEVEGLLHLTLCGYRDIKRQGLEGLKLVKATVPRVEDFIELDQLLGQLVHLLATCEREVPLGCTLRR